MVVVEGTTIVNIVVTYKAVDGYRQRRQFKRLGNAQRFAHKMLGTFVTVGQTYAISSDGIGKITVRGAHLLDLFPRAQVDALQEA